MIPRFGTGIFCVGLAILLAVVAGCRDRAPQSGPIGQNRTPQPPLGREHVTIDGRTFDLELATTVATRKKGLMYRPEIEERGGMLFVFPTATMHEFWMGWCLTDIDILFLDPGGRITAFHHMPAEPPQHPNETEEEYRARMPHYPSRLPAQFVIELKGGTLGELAVAIGDTIDLDLSRLKAMAR